MPTQTVSARSHRDPAQSIHWFPDSPLSMKIETRLGNIETRYGRFVGGPADQVEVIEIDTGKVRAMILPTRGMSIWRLNAGDVAFGWNSPVAGPVHPDQVPIFDPSGIGWLEGFDELVVRCGLESNGAPQHDAQGTLVYPLHGRIANLPATSLSIEFDEASGRIEVIGEMLESRLFIKRLRLRSRIRFHAGSADIELLDDVTNDLSTPTKMQLLYHINVGSPVLGDGATLEAPIETLAPKDSLSASEMDQWNQFGPPQQGYSERVYFAKLRSNESRMTSAMLRAADGESGLGVTFNTKGLSRFILWKNTAAQSDGYVTGMEPATNFPNTREFEESHGRVVEIAGGETESFRVTLHPLVDAESVREMSAKIDTLRGHDPPEINDMPKPGWSPGA
ncbi:hypothetical protein K227x_01770 [Rubripirellula lacrimiformis]|uniref:DUF4432 domain-containing protein n=1 Tax=Rubripirellula lacrimiformis TaxID=1930273 RepID=A0A517N3U4_9BACT|nr:aldose 1-epimerase family protein [Rubripirellula lacrimiformis]QDT01809.1 hypothetical protein K227x_01770 [Rubripirellula lacrimiformis]